VEDPLLVEATLKPLAQHIISVEPLTLVGTKDLIGMYRSRERKDGDSPEEVQTKR
jgi:hypothetical protein